jgi:hypothetical protein
MIGAYFRTLTPYNLHDVEYLAYTIAISATSTHIISSQQLGQIQPYVKYFGDLVANHYHPNEISAEYFTVYFKRKHHHHHTGMYVSEAYNIFEYFMDNYCKLWG